jgi:hypothetical protein
MYDHTMDPIDPGAYEVIRRLEAFADLRLSPSAAAATRMRANIVEAAFRHATQVPMPPAGAASRVAMTAALGRRRTLRNDWQRPLGAVFAGCLTLGLLVGAAVSGRPGGLLYEARLWTETANLPADTVARTDAEVARLDKRMIEAQQAATAGDESATEAALAAYATILIEAANTAIGDPTAAAVIQASVTRHVEALTVMAESAQAPTRAAVQRALSSSATVLHDLDGSGGQGHHYPGGGDHPRERPRPTETPDRTPRPERSPTPTEGRHPAETPRPTETPRPSPTHQPERTQDANDQHVSS